MGVSKGPKNKILIIPEEDAHHKQILKQWVNGNQRQKFQTIPKKMLFKNSTSLNETVRESPKNKIQTIPEEDGLLKRILKYWINANQRHSFQLSLRRCSQQRNLIEIGNTVTYSLKNQRPRFRPSLKKDEKTGVSEESMKTNPIIRRSTQIPNEVAAMALEIVVLRLLIESRKQMHCR